MNQLVSIVPRFAPVSENPTASYLSAMEHWTGYQRWDQLDMEKLPVLAVLIRGFATQESGNFSPPWTDSQIDTACALLQGELSSGIQKGTEA